MIDIIVQRGLGDLPGEDIEDVLITEVTVALQRGRNEIDAHSDLQDMTEVSVLHAIAKPGMTAAVHDAMQGAVWQGKVTAVTHTVDDTGAFTQLSMVREVP